MEMTPQQAIDFIQNNQEKINNTLVDELNELKKKVEKLEQNKKFINQAQEGLD